MASTILNNLSNRPQCGANVVDMTGQKIGRLTVIKRIENLSASDALWLCKCECGNEKIVSRPRLRAGYTQSCGCLYIESRTKKRPHFKCQLPKGEAARRKILYQYKRSAAKRDLIWKLTDEQFNNLINQNCFYCNASPLKTRIVSTNGSLQYNGIDRVDNNEGYVENNVVSCCHICNHAKCKMSKNEFVEWIQKVYQNLKIADGQQ